MTRLLILALLLPSLAWGQSYHSLTPSADLRARWNGDANNDGTGDANDVGGTYNGTFTSGAYGTAPTGKGLGKSFNFSGTTQITSSAVRTGTNARTWTGWVKTTDTTGVLFSIDDGTTGSNGTRWTVRLAGAGVLRIEIQGSGYTSTLDINDGNWHFVAVTFTGTTLAGHVLYMDGSSVNATGANSVSTTATVSRSGLGPSGVTDGELTGEVYDSRLYNVALSAGEVAQLYAGPEPTITSDATITQNGMTVAPVFNDYGNGDEVIQYQWQEEIAAVWTAVSGQTNADNGPADWGADSGTYRLIYEAANNGGTGDSSFSNEVDYVAATGDSTNTLLLQILDQ